jgi:sortase A
MTSQHSQTRSLQPSRSIPEVEGLRVKIAYGSELLLMVVGLALVLVYLLAHEQAAVMSQAGLRSFALQSSTYLPGKAYAGLPAGEVDSSLWSAKRIRAYTDALATELGTPLAVLSIPRLRLDVPVFDGTDELTLNKGAGRIAGTASPGERGNIGIAAHRDGFFRGLKNVQLGDRLELAVPHRRLVYTVDNIAVVKPSDVTVLKDRSRPSLTLVTCYPFYFVGDAPRRYIVQASLANSN